MHSPRSAGRRWRPMAAVSAGLSIVLVAAAAPAVASPATAVPTAKPGKPAAVTETQAITKARATGQSVAVTAATTATETVTANPDGSLTLSQAVQPVRKLVGGSWKDLDATLTRAADGSIVPATAVGDLHLSAGGDGPLATMAGGGRSLALTAPFALPAPSLSGDTATYRQVLPGVDLAVTADTQGGFSEVLIVANAKAAANPRLAKLTFATATKGLQLSADPAGNIIGTDVNGQAVVTAPTPQMWDSAGKVTDVAKSRRSARVGKLGVAVSAGAIALTPARSLLTDPALTWPLLIDPTFSWQATGSAVGGWAVVSKDRPGTNFWKDSPSTQKDMQSGYDSVETGDTRRTLLNFTIDTTRLAGATINDATLNITETWSYNCTPSNVDLYAPGKDLTSSNANWNSWDDTGSYGSRVDQQNVAHGWSSDCKAAGVPFDIATPIRNDASTGNKTQTFVIKANSESSGTGWKRWDKSTPKITIHYDHPPNKPSNLKTSPVTSCSGTTIGDNAVKLYASVSDPDGGTVGEQYTLWKTSNSSVKTSSDPDKLTAPSGSSSVPFTVPELWFKNNSGGVPTKYSWNITITDYKYTATSGTCSFTWDPTRTGDPDVTVPTDARIGLPSTFTITKPLTGTVPSSYQYQINGGPLGSVVADASGNASFTATPRRFTNTVTVTSLSAGGNIGETAAETFTAQPAANAVDGDLTGDGAADLLTVGNANNVPAGLWVARGTGTGAGTPAINVLSTNLGSTGDGTQGDDSPADFNGGQAITGHFTGTGLQDILYYYPTGNRAGGGGVLNGNGDGSPIDANISGAQHTISAGSLSDWNNNSPLTLASVGTAANPYPDLVAINGDPANGYALNYYPNQGGLLNYGFPVQLTVPAPDGTMNWNNWSITTAQTAATGTVMFLWNRGTGALHLWANLAFDVNTGTFSYDANVLADGVSTFFVQSSTVTFQAADIDRNGTPDLWTVGANGAVTAWLVGAIANGTATIAAQTPQTLNTSSHTWMLNDAESGTVDAGQAKDTVGTLHGTGVDAAWNTGDLFDPDVDFNGTSSVITTPKAVTTTADFSVSVWAKPMAYSGNVVSQNGVNGVGFKIWPSVVDASWNFAMQQSDTPFSSVVWDTAKSAGGTAKLGVWYHLTATFQASTKQMTLYVNDRLAGTANHATPWSSVGDFKIGTMRTSNTPTYEYYFKGQIAQVQTWNTVINPQPEPQRGLWDRTRETTGVWAVNGTMIDANKAITETAAAVLPDGTTHAFTLVPNSGVWERVRAANGAWAGTAAKIDTNGSVTAVAAAALPDGTLHLITLLPGSGVWDRTRSAAGVWDAAATKIDTNGSITAIAAAGLPNGTLHLLTLLPSSGVWHASRSTVGVWSAAVKVDTNGSVTDLAAAALPDGTLHLFTVLPGSGVWERGRSATGTWSTSATKVDLNGNVTEVSAAGAEDGTLHFTTTLPGSGLWQTIRSAAGVWQTAGKIEDNASILDTYTVIPHDGTTHVGYIPDVS